MNVLTCLIGSLPSLHVFLRVHHGAVGCLLGCCPFFTAASLLASASLGTNVKSGNWVVPESVSITLLFGFSRQSQYRIRNCLSGSGSSVQLCRVYHAFARLTGSKTQTSAW